MRRANSDRSDFADNPARWRQTGELKTRVLVVEDHPKRQESLAQLIEQEDDLAVCLEAKSVDQAWKIVGRERVDLVIVDVAPGRRKKAELIEKIRLECPRTSILIFSAPDRTPNAGRPSAGGPAEYSRNQEVREKVLKGVCYVQSLLRSGVYGFTILVKV